MPMYDTRCNKCGNVTRDVLEAISAPRRNCHMCEGGLAERVWLPGNANAVIGDEIDVEIKHGVCNEDGSPRRFRSRQELARVAAEKGWVNRVEHLGKPGSDRSKHTSRWV